MTKRQRKARRKRLRFLTRWQYRRGARFFTWRTIELMFGPRWKSDGIWFTGEIGRVESIRYIETNHAKS